MQHLIPTYNQKRASARSYSKAFIAPAGAKDLKTSSVQGAHCFVTSQAYTFTTDSTTSP